MEIPRRETIKVEFKSDRKGYSDDGLVDEIVGMANSEGGTLFLGVEDNGEVSGLSAKHQDPIGLTALIANKTVPPVSARAETVNVEGKAVMLVNVPKSASVVASSSGRIMRRRLKVDGTPENVPMYPYEITGRLADLGRLDFSAHPLDASLEDLDSNQMARLRASIRNRNGDKSLLELSDEELAKALRLAVDVDGALTPTVTGLLLIGKAEAIQRLVPTMRADFQVLEGTQVRVNESFTKPILEVIELFNDYMKPWNPEREMEHGLYRLPVPEFSQPAFREGLVNAFAHRDYSILGAVRVLIDDDGLTISSPGGFIDGVSLENLLTVEPHGRNQCLSDVLKRIGLAERTGRGIDRIFEGAITLGRPWPDYSESTARNVTLFMPRTTADLPFVKALAEEQDRRGRTLSINHLLILSLLRREGPMRVDEISGATHIQPVRLKNILADMVEEGLLTIEGGPRSSAFALSLRVLSAMGETSKALRSANDTAKALDEIIRLAEAQEGNLCKADVMERLRVGPNRAYEYLRLLQEQGKLEIVHRGKYARYRLSGC